MDDVTLVAESALGATPASEAAAGRSQQQNILIRAQKLSSGVRDILGEKIMGGCHLETVTLPPASLLVPISEAETEAPAVILRERTAQQQVKRKRPSFRFPSSSLKPPTSSPVKVAFVRTPVLTVKPKVQSPPTSTFPEDSTTAEKELHNTKPLSVAAPAGGDLTMESSSYELIVELSSASSAQSDDVYVALESESSESVACRKKESDIEQENDRCRDADLEVNSYEEGRLKGKNEKKRGEGMIPDAELELTTRERRWSVDVASTHEVGRGRGGVVVKEKIGCKDRRLRQLQRPDRKVSRRMRSLADVYRATENELRGHAWKVEEECRGSCQKAQAVSGLGRKRSCVSGEIFGGSRVDDDGLHLLGSIMEEEARSMQRVDQSIRCRKDEVVGGLGLIDGSKFTEEESDEALAWTLMCLNASSIPSLYGYETQDSLKPAKEGRCTNCTS